MDFDDSALDMGQPAPKAAPKAAPKTAPKSTGGTKPAPANPKAAGGAKPAPAVEPAPPAPQDKVLPPVAERNQFREERAAARKAYDKKQDDFYQRKLADVKWLRENRQLGTLPGSGVDQGAQFWAEEPPLRPTRPANPGAYGAFANTIDTRGVRGLEVTPRPEKGPVLIYPTRIESAPFGGTGPLPFMGAPDYGFSATRPDNDLSQGLVEVPTDAALNSVRAFRTKAEELGTRYRNAIRERERGEAEIERVKRAPETLFSRDLPVLARLQRRRTQEFVNAREALRQMGLNDADMKQRFSPSFEPAFGPEDTNNK